MRKALLMAMVAATAIAACAKKKAAEPEAAAPEAATPAAVEPAAPVEAAPVEAPFDVSGAPAGVYKSDPKHAYITFSYEHQGYSHPWLRWRTWNADLNWNPAAPDQSTIVATIDVASVDSGVDEFDDHLRSADFFDVANNPAITFKSTSISLSGGSKGAMTGDLTIKGVTKPVTLDVTINRAADDSFAKANKLGFSAKGAVKRSDFGVDKYVPFVGDDVTVLIEAEFLLPKPEGTSPQ